jgi:hypothetical protein
MSREWRIVMETEAADEVADALNYTDLDVDRDGNCVFCYADAPHNPKRVRKELMHELAAFDLAGSVPNPLPIEHWDESQECYVDSRGIPAPPTREEEALSAALDADRIRWAVAVEPSSVFELRKLREELRARRRHEIGETKRGFEVGARDEADACVLCQELEGLSVVGSVSARKLGWLARWQFREHLAGNYAGEPDPTQPF